jgi:plasmid stability protein
MRIQRRRMLVRRSHPQEQSSSIRYTNGGGSIATSAKSRVLLLTHDSDRGTRFKARAAANHQSLSDEVITILEAAFHDRSGPPTLDEIDHLRAQGRRPLRQAIVDRARRRER